MNTTDDKTRGEAFHGPNLSLLAENFGPMTLTDVIRIAPMTVFVGPSNTGKTYLAKALHGFMVAIDTALQDIVGTDPFRNTFHYATRHTDVAYLGSDLVSCRDAISSCPTNHKDYFLVPVALLQPSSQNFIRSVLGEFKENIDNCVRKTFLEFFDVPFLSRLTYQQLYPSCYPEVDLYIDYDVDNDPTCVSLVDEDSSLPLQLNTILLPRSFVDHLYQNSRIPTERFYELIAENFDVFLRLSVSRLFADGPRSHYLPSDRSGLMNAITLLPEGFDIDNLRPTYRIGKEYIKLINAAIHGRAVSGGIDRVPFTRVHMLERRLSDEVVNNIRDAVIAGNLVRYGNMMDPQTFNTVQLEYKSEHATTPLTASSSMINQVAPMLLFIERYVYQGDTLIIDEPESHLHPAAQQEMAAILTYLVRSGVKVLITTHSHYIVEQIGNFVTASMLEPETRRRVLAIPGPLGQEDVYLREAEVAVFDFKHNDSLPGSTVDEVAYNEDYGYFPKDHNWAIADQMNRTQRVIEARIALEDEEAID